MNITEGQIKAAVEALGFDTSAMQEVRSLSFERGYPNDIVTVKWTDVDDNWCSKSVKVTEGPKYKVGEHGAVSLTIRSDDDVEKLLSEWAEARRQKKAQQ